MGLVLTGGGNAKWQIDEFDLDNSPPIIKRRPKEGSQTLGTKKGDPASLKGNSA